MHSILTQQASYLADVSTMTVNQIQDRSVMLFILIGFPSLHEQPGRKFRGCPPPSSTVRSQPQAAVWFSYCTDMDLRGSQFEAGPREIGGAVDLISQYKLLPHHGLFCRKSLPLSLTETRYLRNEVGDREIRKGEGMEFDQLFRNASNLRESDASIRPFELGALLEAFRLKETPPVDLCSAEKGISKIDSKDRGRKHKKHVDRDKERDSKKNTLLNEDKNNVKDLKRRMEPRPEKEHKSLKNSSLNSVVALFSYKLCQVLITAGREGMMEYLLDPDLHLETRKKTKLSE